MVYDYFGLGLLLRSGQSESKFLVIHHLKKYHARNDGWQNAFIEAFANWKPIYNVSMHMTYGAPANISSFGNSIDLPQFRMWALSGKHTYPRSQNDGMAC